MNDFWETKFKNEGAMWKFEPSDSAISALDLFKSNHIHSVLIPGFGYGRNARLFLDAGMKVSGIEISESAIALARAHGMDCTIHHGSVTSMPFDNEQFDAVFCYALLHLLSKSERKNFLAACFKQVRPGGYMVFTVVSQQASMFGQGKKISSNRFRIAQGINVYFYNRESAEKEFERFGNVVSKEIDEPIKFMINEDPLKCILVICQKNQKL